MKILRLLIQFKRNAVEGETDTFKEYLYDINRLANTEKEKLEKMVKGMVDKYPDDAHEIYDHYSEQYGLYETRYIEFANNGTLVSAYSFFEHQLKEITRMLQRDLVNKKKKYKHNNSLSYAENLKNEIFVTTGLDFSSLNPLWTSLEKYRHIRNSIVHNGANLIEDETKDLIDQKKYPVVSSFSEIKI